MKLLRNGIVVAEAEASEIQVNVAEALNDAQVLSLMAAQIGGDPVEAVEKAAAIMTAAVAKSRAMAAAAKAAVPKRLDS